MTDQILPIDINSNNWGEVISKINSMIPLIPDDFVTSVDISVPSGLDVSGGPITSAGSLTINYAAGYQGYTTAEANKLADLHNNFVTSVGVTVPTGLDVSNSPITNSGNISITYTSGYQGYTTAEANKLAGIQAGAQVNTVTSVAGKTGAVALAKGDVGLGNVDNTSDLNKPISNAVNTAITAAPIIPTTTTVSTVDFNTLTNPGYFTQLVRGNSANGWGGTDYGHLLVLKYGSAITQFIFPYQTPASTVRYRTLVGGTWTAWTSIGNMAFRDVFVSTSAPSGGNNGDIWYQV